MEEKASNISNEPPGNSDAGVFLGVGVTPCHSYPQMELGDIPSGNFGSLRAGKEEKRKEVSVG